MYENKAILNSEKNKAEMNLKRFHVGNQNTDITQEKGEGSFKLETLPFNISPFFSSSFIRNFKISVHPSCDATFTMLTNEGYCDGPLEHLCQFLVKPIQSYARRCLIDRLQICYINLIPQITQNQCLMACTTVHQ